jgi:hypothetical protein
VRIISIRNGEDCVEPGGELRVAIAEQEPQLVGSLVEFHDQVTGLLGDPDTGGCAMAPAIWT